ncbi:hypothetical protein HMPREF1868_00434 [Olsenella sp. DNF00959]|nr:hypothetical protein HMPREF1868_00434 [Olsenella sp. DNF00959]
MCTRFSNFSIFLIMNSLFEEFCVVFITSMLKEARTAPPKGTSGANCPASARSNPRARRGRPRRPPEANRDGDPS